MINNNIKLLLKKWLCKVVAFYTDQPYQLVLDQHQQFALKPASNNEETKWLLIVGRQHYNEQLSTYPIVFSLVEVPRIIYCVGKIIPRFRQDVLYTYMFCGFRNYRHT